MRVRVFFSGTSMSCPARVADAECALDGMFAQDFFKVGKLTLGAANLKRSARRAADGDSCRIVTAVFETPQTLNEDGNDILGANITNNSAHKKILSDGGFRQM